MGYDIHITRRVHWSDEGDPAITLDEWRTVVENDPELVGLPPTKENPLVAMMLSPHKERKAARYFRYSSGEIFVSKPCKAVVLKMLEVARSLNARVIGDEDEVYSEDGAPCQPSSYTVDDSW